MHTSVRQDKREPCTNARNGANTRTAYLNTSTALQFLGFVSFLICIRLWFQTQGIKMKAVAAASGQGTLYKTTQSVSNHGQTQSSDGAEDDTSLSGWKSASLPVLR